MKRVKVVVEAEYLVPDDWEIVEYKEDDVKFDVIKIDGEYCDFDIEYMIGHQDKDGTTTWTTKEEFYEKVGSCMETLDTKITVI